MQEIQSKKITANFLFSKGKEYTEVAQIVQIEIETVKMWYDEYLNSKYVFFTSRHFLILFIILLLIHSITNVAKVLWYIVPFQFNAVLTAITICLAPLALLIHPLDERKKVNLKIIEIPTMLVVSIVTFFIVFTIEVVCNCVETNTILIMLDRMNEGQVPKITNVFENTFGIKKNNVALLFGVLIPFLAFLFQVVLLKFKSSTNIFIIKNK